MTTWETNVTEVVWESQTAPGITWTTVVGGTSSGGGVTVHNDLSGRSAADAHPMSAITDLEPALTDIATAVQAQQGDIGTLQTAVALKQAADADLTAIAALAPSDDALIQRKSGAWTSRTPAQVKADMSIGVGDVSGLDENTRDVIGTALVAGSGVAVTVDDPGNTITIAVSGVVADAINDGTTTVAPSQNAVFDALALTVPTSRTLAGLDLSADRTASTLRTALSLVPGTDVQAYDADLGQIATATFSNDDFVQKKSGSLTNRTIAQVKTDLGIVDTVADGVLSGQLTLPGVYISGAYGAAIAANYVYAHPFVVRTPRTVSGLRIYVGTAASGKFARLGIINVDTGWQSSIAPIVDAGAVTVGSTGEQTATFSTITLQPGRYCTVLVSDGAPLLNFLLGPSFAGIAAVNSYWAVLEFSCAMTYGAFPTPWNISLTANYNVGGGRWAVRLVP